MPETKTEENAGNEEGEIQNLDEEEEAEPEAEEEAEELEDIAEEGEKKDL